MARIILGIISVLGLMAVRAFESQWFYDPFLQYFKAVNVRNGLPDYELGKLILHHFFRFFLNTIFSLGLIYSLFRSVKWIKVSVVLMILFYLLSLVLYLFMIETALPYGAQPAFYVRRFIIQPMLLFLLIPTFYYLDKKKIS